MLVKVENLTIKKGNRQIISNFSLSIGKGEFIMITGKSGSGKTSLIDAISLLETEYIENISYLSQKINSKNIQRLRKNVVSYMFQNYGLLENMTVWENIKIAAKLNKKFNKEQLLKLFEKLSLSETLLDKKIYLLSGGEQQRIALIRSVIKPFDIIFADEPTGNLDEQNAQLIINYFTEIITWENKTVVMVTHDKTFLKYATKVLSID